MEILIQLYTSTRNKTQDLCKPLKKEDYTPQSAEFASPPKWHLAHTSWFFEEMILKAYSNAYQVFDASYSFLFNSYYNSVGERIERKNRGLITRPSIDKVYEYRAYVDKHMTALLQSNPSKKIEELTVLGVNHEQQHQELLITDLKHTFSCNPIYPRYSETNYMDAQNKSNGWVEIPEGVYNIGHDGTNFCYDNELGKHRVFLEPFKMSKALVTNADYIKFINDNGYEQVKYWLDDAWHWIKENKIKSPLYWKLIDNVWHQYTLSGLQPVNPEAILTHISYYEAAAYAFWAGYRLPTEFEWEIASKQLDWGSVWEWTNSAYLPYPNFEIAKGAVGEYNGKFMVNLMVLRGASLATAKNHSRNTYRNFFSPSTQWQFSGIRLAK
ncbi:ergothioneine biosynthesis protein EgtB [Xanthomarina sp. F1114]|uniref:ergothioneine biosynthesis protein EgtB n=1 Tax=Xanthomarina sp. F1114 TaxID=2996019 RepID=UPI00225E31F1|nr:ergothioneine biosynthesis protein EgtB [Xanthomarina sp. F1114]MCX7548160.1 ergothioneine biosynthesis protein EgtB [Xanthomarina sp. F1114]